MIVAARREIQIAAFVFTSSAVRVMDLLGEAAERGVSVLVILNRLEDQPEAIRVRLDELSEQFHHFRVLSFSDESGGQLHAKVVVVDRERALIGSANLSWGGLVSNHEVAVIVHGDLGWRLAAVLDGLTSSRLG